MYHTSQFLDDVAEYRLLGAVIEQPEVILKLTQDLFTGTRTSLYNAMLRAYTTYGEISYEGVRRYYGSDIPAEVDVARGGKVSAVLDHLLNLATKRQLAHVQEQITLSLQQPYLNREELNQILHLKPIMSREDSSLTSG